MQERVDVGGLGRHGRELLLLLWSYLLLRLLLTKKYHFQKFIISKYNL